MFVTYPLNTSDKVINAVFQLTEISVIRNEELGYHDVNFMFEIHSERLVFIYQNDRNTDAWNIKKYYHVEGGIRDIETLTVGKKLAETLSQYQALVPSLDFKNMVQVRRYNDEYYLDVYPVKQDATKQIADDSITFTLHADGDTLSSAWYTYDIRQVSGGIMQVAFYLDNFNADYRTVCVYTLNFTLLGKGGVMDGHCHYDTPNKQGLIPESFVGRCLLIHEYLFCKRLQEGQEDCDLGPGGSGCPFSEAVIYKVDYDTLNVSKRAHGNALTFRDSDPVFRYFSTQPSNYSFSHMFSESRGIRDGVVMVPYFISKNYFIFQDNTPSKKN
eukprot:TRINITY_DN10885_c0_g3_i1.p1 TRINITY_DN10885_c0_g3~~TRINITY_DN10885_c0_g3_i1.p1  ORF type:complete len:329 (-),score=92.48 TRINITY_DN10885_c0_g3_i1:587-1573(-)